jgi:hypothetical protein
MENQAPSSSGTTRREFLTQVAAATTLAAVTNLPIVSGAATQPATDASPPWYRRAVRWGQTNINEADIDRYDIAWWREQWKRTEVQGVIINAGGIVAYYPSKFPLHYHPPNLKDRDLYGELARAAHDDGLAVLARMDSNKAHEPLYRAHPDWFAVDIAGHPYRNGEFYLPCINSPYYEQWLPDIMREIIERSHPEGITDNGWSGVDRNSICYCRNCVERFGKFGGKEVPVKRDWNDANYRKWIDWNYARRIEQWDFNNRVTRDAGGKDCLWAGMNSSDVAGQGNNFRDLKEIAERSEIFMLDHQSRDERGSIGENAQAGKLVHGLLGWDKLIPESMAMYQSGRPQFRFASASKPEARMWMLSGIAGGIQPWWHHIGAYHEDRRMYRTAEPVMKWHRDNQQYLLNRSPMANVAIGWSQRNTDFFGRDNVDELVEQPARGFAQALVRARIPFVPVHLDHLDRDAERLSVLILPNIGAMSDQQIEAIRRFVGGGGALVATGQTSLFDQRGDARPDFALADIFGVSGGKAAPESAAPPRGAVRPSLHTYLRLTPELRGQVDGPKSGSEPAITGNRHPVLAGFDETDILPFGGMLGPLRVAAQARVVATFIPPFPQSPPEDVWMRTPRTEIPALVVRDDLAGRIVYLPADIDRHFAVENLPDHGDLLANIVRWASKKSIPLDVQGAGLVNCEIYQQDQRLILHVVNLTSAGTWRAPIHELIPIGPLQVKLRLPVEFRANQFKTLVTGNGGALRGRVDAGWASFQLDSVLDHEVVVIES